MKRSVLTAAAIAVMCLTVPAAAATFNSTDDILSIEVPDNWQEVSDPAKWFALSDGANIITVDHYSNGEKLPDITVADAHYVNVYEAVFSTQNEVFIITGSVVDAAKIPEVANAIMSTKVLKYDTKLAVQKESEASVSEFSVVPMNKTMYVTSDGLNVRMGCSTSERILGAYAKGDSVQVTGTVQRNGADIGWYQVAYENGNGYVSTGFLSETAPAKTDNQASADQNKSENKSSSSGFTGNVKTIYASDGTAVTVYESKDGNWYDGIGNKFIWTTTYEFVNADGSKQYSVNKPADTSSDVYAVDAPFTVYWANGNGETLTLYSDGYYYSSGWVRYTEGSENNFIGADGTVLYGSLGGPQEPVYDNSDQEDADEGETYVLVRREDGASVVVHSGGGAYYDEDGTEYSWISDGGMMDYYGHEYDVQ